MTITNQELTELGFVKKKNFYFLTSTGNKFALVYFNGFFAYTFNVSKLRSLNVLPKLDISSLEEVKFIMKAFKLDRSDKIEYITKVFPELLKEVKENISVKFETKGKVTYHEIMVIWVLYHYHLPDISTSNRQKIIGIYLKKDRSTIYYYLKLAQGVLDSFPNIRKQMDDFVEEIAPV